MSESWADLSVKLSPEILKALSSVGFEKPTAVQSAVVPLLLSHKDVAVEAVTGSGKTLAFLVPVLQILLRRTSKLRQYDVGSVIILPTRELATQVYEVLKELLKSIPQLTTLLFVGGKSVAPDVRRFSEKGAHIVVSTPGRLMDLLSQKQPNHVAHLASSCRSLEVLVLDEADRLLDCGFKMTLSTILAYMPKQRRTGIFSATQTDDLKDLVRAGLRNPVQVKVKEKADSRLRTPASLKNFYMTVKPQNKIALLLTLLNERKSDKMMVFFASSHCVEYFSLVVKKVLPNLPMLSLHGRMKSKRFQIFNKFRKMEIGALLCTDVMCRGIDIPSVEWVIQVDVPSAASFVHRCGRTARNGEPGTAIILLLPNEVEYAYFVEMNQKVSLKEMPLPDELPDTLETMRELQIEDRAIMEKAMQAFVSYIMAYSKHECKLIINLNRLNMGLLAMGFGLLKLPRMPELKTASTKDFKPPPPEIDVNAIKYKDEVKEKERRENVATYKRTGVWPKLKVFVPHSTKEWSGQKEKRQKRKAKSSKSDHAKIELTDEDYQELDDDYRTLKKLKKGKLTKEQVEKFFNLDKDFGGIEAE